jgi:hypothetical protein
MAMKNSSVLMVSLTALSLGFIAGQEFTKLLASESIKSSQQLMVGEFTVRLREDATTLALIKRNRLECAQSFLEMRVKSTVAAAGSYRLLASESSKARLDRAWKFGNEQLQMPRLVNADDPKNCTW